MSDDQRKDPAAPRAEPLPAPRVPARPPKFKRPRPQMKRQQGR